MRERPGIPPEGFELSRREPSEQESTERWSGSDILKRVRELKGVLPAMVFIQLLQTTEALAKRPTRDYDPTAPPIHLQERGDDASQQSVETPGRTAEQSSLPEGVYRFEGIPTMSEEASAELLHYTAENDGAVLVSTLEKKAKTFEGFNLEVQADTIEARQSVLIGPDSDKLVLGRRIDLSDFPDEEDDGWRVFSGGTAAVKTYTPADSSELTLLSLAAKDVDGIKQLFVQRIPTLFAEPGRDAGFRALDVDFRAVGGPVIEGGFYQQEVPHVAKIAGEDFYSADVSGPELEALLDEEEREGIRSGVDHIAEQLGQSSNDILKHVHVVDDFPGSAGSFGDGLVVVEKALLTSEDPNRGRRLKHLMQHELIHDQLDGAFREHPKWDAYLQSVDKIAIGFVSEGHMLKDSDFGHTTHVEYSDEAGDQVKVVQGPEVLASLVNVAIEDVVNNSLDDNIHNPRNVDGRRVLIDGFRVIAEILGDSEKFRDAPLRTTLLDQARQLEQIR